MKKSPSLIISAGKGCFTCCKGCYQFFGKNNLNTSNIIDFVRKYQKEFDLKKVTLAGGDPMTREDIVYLVDTLRSMNLEISMDTTGKNFIGDEKIVFMNTGKASYVPPKLLQNKISKIGIPLDGYTTEQINSFRTLITLDEILKILDILNNNDYNICINTVVNKNNAKDLKKIFDIIKKYKNITKWQLFQYSPIGELGYKNRKNFEIEEEEFNYYISDLKKYINNYDIIIEPKSNSYRKLNYILINSDGNVWQPLYDLNQIKFNKNDISPDKIIIGNIDDKDILKKIKNHLCEVEKKLK